MVIPFIRVTDLKREIHGITKEEALSLAHKGDISLCVFLDSGDRLSTVPAPYNDVFCFENDYAEVSGNVNGGKGKGLFKIADSEVFGKLFNGKKDINNIFHEVQVSPYGVEFSKYMGLPQEYFGDDPLSKLVIPSQELDKLSAEAPADELNTTERISEAKETISEPWHDKSHCIQILKDLVKDKFGDEKEEFDSYPHAKRKECLESIKEILENQYGVKVKGDRVMLGPVKNVFSLSKPIYTPIIREAFGLQPSKLTK